MSLSGKHAKPGVVSRFHGDSTANSDGLTCSEGQVEDLLSEGESTEIEPTKTAQIRKAAAKKPPL